MERNEAKIQKDFKKADQIRNELKARGVHITDTRDGTTWSYKDTQEI